MPRVISDELYEDLISNINEGRLLGVMGKLERLQREAKAIIQTDEYFSEDDNRIISTYETDRR